MERMLVVVFDSEDKAYEGNEALRGLVEESVIRVHVSAVVTKDRNSATTVNKTHYALPEGTMGGTVVGGLIGLLGGPVGLALGAATGIAIGATTDVVRTRVESDFLSAVIKALEPGKTAVVAEIYEESTDPVDERMKALGGFVLRRDLSDVRDAVAELEIARIQHRSKHNDG